MLDDLYRRFPATFVARRNLTRNKVRSTLTVLGIAIGVIAVASLGIFGNTLQADVTGSLAGLGSTVVVTPNYDAGYERIDDDDLRTIRRSVDDATVVPLKSDFTLVAAEGGDSSASRIYGVDDPRSLVSAQEGEVPSNFRDGALVGPSAAEKLGVEVGDEVVVDGTAYRVAAILEPNRVSPLNTDEAVFLPTEHFDSEGYPLVMVEAESATAANATALAIKGSVNDRDRRVTVTELSDQVDRVKNIFSTLNTFLTGVAAISLFVAGVGILNVMLMSAVERRQEVGVLRAVGLRRFDVLKIMLIEAALLGVVGSLVGGLVSAGSGMVVNAYILDAPLRAFTPDNLGYLAFAVAFGVAIGVLSGVYPAWKASRERPVEALRS